MDLIPEGSKVAAPGTSRKALIADDDEAWTAPSSPAFVQLKFPSPVDPTRIALTFQGGFVATSVALTATTEAGDVMGTVYPEDKNAQMKSVTALRLDMKSSTDFGGRITIYRLELL